MRIKELSKKYGVDLRTIDYYSNVAKILPYKQCNTTNTYRNYDVESEEILKRILIYRELGYSIDKIRKILNGSEIDNTTEYEYIAKLNKKKEEEINRINKLIEYTEDVFDTYRYCMYI